MTQISFKTILDKYNPTAQNQFEVLYRYLAASFPSDDPHSETFEINLINKNLLSVANLAGWDAEIVEGKDLDWLTRKVRFCKKQQP